MIGLLSGKISNIGQGRVIVDVNGVGYLVSCIQRDLSQLTVNQTEKLHIHTHVKEDALDLYGFLSPDDLEVFEHLITVSGVGPRIGLAILSHYQAQEVKDAVAHADTNFFLSVSGIGKKNAQKIIVELKSKFGSVKELDLSEDEKQKFTELVAALKSLGYKSPEIKPLLKRIPSELSNVEDQVRYALRELR